MTVIDIPNPKISQFLFSDTRMSWLWLIVRLYLGHEWLSASLDKINNPAHVWIGEKAGVAVEGFLNGALQKTSGLHPDVTGWYAWFIQNIALPHSAIFSYMVTFGELLVGVALILGFLVGVSSFFGAFLNFQFMFAGTVSINPEMIILEILLMLSWRTAGYYGLDYFVLPYLPKRRELIDK